MPYHDLEKLSGNAWLMKKKSNRTTSDVANPHDKFVREVWSREEVAWDFLSRYLPPAIASRLVPGSLRLRKDSFVDGVLREHLSDLLYQVRLQGGGERPWSMSCWSTRATRIPGWSGRC